MKTINLYSYHLKGGTIMSKFKFNKGLIPKLIVIGIFLALVIIAIISDKVLTGTAFGDFVNNTIGKFFNIIDILKNHWITIAESIVIIVFFWLLNKLFSIFYCH